MHLQLNGGVFVIGASIGESCISAISYLERAASCVLSNSNVRAATNNSGIVSRYALLLPEGSVLRPLSTHTLIADHSLILSDDISHRYTFR